MHSLILSNSQTLFSLYGQIPHIPGISVSFPNLKELDCEWMTDQDVANCPKLQAVTVKSESSLENLPVQSMQELKMDIDFPLTRERNTRILNPIQNIVSRLVNLKVLRISFGMTTVTQSLRHLKTNLLENHRHLEKLSLGFALIMDGTDVKADDDGLVEHVLSTNPHIIEIGFLYLSEKGIRSLSRFTNLVTVTDLRVASPARIVPMLSVLLTGNSRNSLQTVSAGVQLSKSKNLSWRNDVPGIRNELAPLLQETGFIHSKYMVKGRRQLLVFSRNPT